MEPKRTFRPLRILLLLIIFVCLIPVLRFHFTSMQHEKQQKALRNAGPHPEDAGPELKSSGNGTSGTSSGKGEILDKFQTLYSENSDLAGWLFIEGTNINNPVMKCEDDEYYLSHDFYRQNDKYGCLFVRNTADLHTPGTNFIIYGHNMKDGFMFGELDAYQSEDFCREHPVISFDTLYEERSYEVIAAFQAKVFPEDLGNQPQPSKDPSAFKYYEFYQADTEEDFLYFYENIKKLSFYDTGVTAAFGDTFLTLSTCSYHTDDGRFVVVAKRIP